MTIVTYQRELLLDTKIFRKVAETMWERIPQHFRLVELDQWVVMPNQVHGILWIVGVWGRHSTENFIDQGQSDVERVN